jgi:hypothetical protein
MWPAMSMPMSVCHVTTCRPRFGTYQPLLPPPTLPWAALRRYDRQTPACMHWGAQPSSSEPPSRAAAALPTAEITLRCGCSAQKLRLRYFVFGRPYEPEAGSPARLSIGEQVAVG